MAYWTGISKGNPRESSIIINTVFEVVELTAFQWTTEAPTKPGWYWVWVHHQNTHNATLLYIYEGGYWKQFDEIHDEGELVSLSELYTPLSKSYLGPLPEPEHPQVV